MQILQMQRASVRLQSTALFLFMAAVTWPQCGAFAQTFKSFDFPGAVNTQATAVNPSGEIVGRYFDADGSQHGFVFRHGMFTSIDYPGAVLTDITWVNAQGEIVGAYNLGTGNRGFLLHAGQFTTIDYAGLANSYATGISRTGEIVGVGSDNAGNFIGFLVKNGKFSPVALPGAAIVFQEPTMLEDGPIVGGYVDNLGTHGYLLVGASFQTIDCPGATGGIYLSAIDVFGRMAGEMTTPDGHQHGLLINRGQCLAVDYPDSVSTYANGINQQGDIVGRYTDTDGKTHGFIAKHFVE